MWPYVDELFQDDELTDTPRRGGRRRRSLPASGRTLTASPARSWRKPSWRCRTFRQPPAAAARASTPSTWATSWRRCRSWPANIPARAGDRVHFGLRNPDHAPPQQQAWDIAATVCDPEIPVLTIEDLGILRDVQVAGETASRSPSRPRTRAARPWTPSGDDLQDRLRQGGLRGRARGPGARPGLDHGLDDRGRQGQAAGVRHRPAHRHERRRPGTPVPSGCRWP